MNTKFQILTDEKYVRRQFYWLEKQIENYKEDSFKDYELARAEFDRGMLTAYSAPKILFAFVDEFLSDVGIKRLNTALKVAKKRDADRKASSQKLEVILDLETTVLLNELAEKTDLTKTEIIKQLIQNATKDIFTEDFQPKL